MQRIIFLHLIILGVLLQQNAFGQKNGKAIFNDTYVHEIRIEFYETAFWDSLVKYTNTALFTGDEQCTLADVSIDGNIVDSIGVRFKGFSSNFNAQTRKRPFKLDFPEFVKGKRYDGLKKLNLNNSWNDPTFLRDVLAFKVLRDFGVFAPRTSYTKLYINNVFWGLYIVVEEVDDKFLDNWFKDDNGDFFKCKINTDLKYFMNDTVLYAQEMEPRNDNKPTDWTYYDNFLKAFNNPNAFLEDSLEKYLYLDEFLKVLAVDIVSNNSDCYANSGQNFYLYLNPDDYRYYWIPWDYNLSFGSDLPLVPNYPCVNIPGQLDCKYLVKSIMQNQQLKSRYANVVCELLQNHFDSAYLFPFIETTIDMIRPFVAADTLKFFPDLASFDACIANDCYVSDVKNVSYSFLGIKSLIQERKQNLLSENLLTGIACNNQLSVSNISETDFLLYPNPSNGVFRLSVSDSLLGATVLIYNTTGTLVWAGETSSDKNEFSIELQQGVYIVALVSNNLSKTFTKVIVTN